ncbi:LysR family transcriptional regulator [Rhodobacteraceae bacterium 2376]|uniref:LysR family transcriptional regulator n=1 Tax=Rhabdonatronobacter sediminivivens TaxID=2743469 RepID=A0A7Z0KZ44_9RHOB|nr:LysR substrate-binding domain-containing protein [Rhabdonatronobacter sediminivivens]NYS26317.1 LysR family transcriptional regulator [Rhabdonatronobacter sediminivivens]
MRYVQLRAFHYVATCGGFSRAAEELHLTQPALSDQVRKLEEEYDVLLFNRVRKQVTLTPQGERLLTITRRFFDNEREAFEYLAEGRALRSGTLRIIADSASHLTHVLPLFRQKYAAVTLSVLAGNTETVVQALQRYDADIGVLGTMPDCGRFEMVPLGQSPIIAFVARDHPLASKESLSLQDLAVLPLVLREDGSRTRTRLEEAAHAAGVTLSPAIVAEGREAVREIVAAGAGIGFVSLAEFGEDTRLKRIPLRDAAGLVMEETLICLPERRDRKLVRAFMELARTARAEGVLPGTASAGA